MKDTAILSEHPEPNQKTTWADAAEVIGSIAWLWLNWLAKGFFHLLVGYSGEGKSGVVLNSIGNTVLKGQHWPDGSPFIDRTAGKKMAWMEAEAAQAINLTRAKAW